MIRTQIQLTEAQVRGLKKIARLREVSVAAVIRESVDDLIASQAAGARGAAWEAAQAVIGKYRSGAPDAAHEHDRYLDEAFAA